MATNQMEMACIARRRNKAIARIIDRYPDSNLHVAGDGLVLKVVASGSGEHLTLNAKRLGADWGELMQTVDDFSYYDCHLPDYGYYWIDKNDRRDWTLSHTK